MTNECEGVQASDHVLEWKLEEVTERVGIPENHRNKFRRSIRTQIYELRRGFFVKPQTVYRGRYLDVLDRHQSETESLRKWLANEEQNGAAGSAWAQVNAFLHGKREDSDTFLENGLEFLLELERAFARAKLIGVVYNERGRAHGAQQNGAQHCGQAVTNFIECLIRCIRGSGGVVTSSRTLPTRPANAKGHISELLTILRQFLPKDFPEYESGLGIRCERINARLNDEARQEREKPST
jgi:hypothetical protein